ncbi:MAG: hypothetical protein Q9174_004919, partial [Haloplaca sp. 1 TL-2023]
MEKTPVAMEREATTKGERDAAVLARLGKKSVLERRFGFLSICGFTCTILVTWEGSLILFVTGLNNGGSAGLIFGYLFVWIGTLSVFTTMAEMASMAPTTGGQYHWTAQLAPPNCRKFLSYIIGWLVICGWMAILAGSGYVCGTQIQALIQLNNPDYMPEQWQGTLLFWACVLIAVLVNTVLGKTLPMIETFMLVIHVLGFFAILIPLVYVCISSLHLWLCCQIDLSEMQMAPKKASAHDVFTQFQNAGGYPSDGLSFLVGLIGTVFAMF